MDILKELKKNVDNWGNEYGYYFSVYFILSESLIDCFCCLDIEKFGIVENIIDKEYYINSFYYDVCKNLMFFEKFDFEKDYLKYCFGGFIYYCEYFML